jgi:putative endonuclease
MFKNKLAEGKRGEEIAVEFLTKKGIKIIDRNFRIRGDEIDIIGLENNTLVFFEVKTRVSTEFGSPLEAITYWKLRSLIKTAQFYKLKHSRLPDSMRIDAISIKLDESERVVSIELVKNISGF